MKRQWFFWLMIRLMLLLTLLSLLACDNGSGSGGSGDIVAPPADSDQDGVPDSSDDCPYLPGESESGGCPWYLVDECSGDNPYALTGQRWLDMTPAFYYSSSLPSNWRNYVDFAANQWNAVNTELEIRKYTTIVDAGVGMDQRNVVSYGPINGSSALGRCYMWYYPDTGVVFEADIRLNSNQPLGIGKSSTTYDLVSVLVHEFGHFCGLAHVSDRTHTMYPELPKNCTIYRTLCAGDRRGLRVLY